MSNITALSDIKHTDKTCSNLKWDIQLEKYIQNCIITSLSSEDYIESIFNKFASYYVIPCHNMAQLQKRTKKQQGNLWEHFCLLYLRAKGYGEAWLIGDTPEEILD